MNDLVRGWKDHPPVSILVKAFFDMETKAIDVVEAEVPVDDKVSSLSAHLVKHGAAKAIPILRSPDLGPAPIFDLDAMRAKNAALAKRIKLS